MNTHLSSEPFIIKNKQKFLGFYYPHINRHLNVQEVSQKIPKGYIQTH